MANYSENEKKIFKKFLHEYNLRIDGRTHDEFRNFQIQTDIIPSCLSSIKLTFGENLNDVIIAIKVNNFI